MSPWMCGVCGRMVAEKPSRCPDDGAGPENFKRIMGSFVWAGGRYRLDAERVSCTRDWLRRYFRELCDDEGDHIYLYVRDGAELFEVTDAPHGVTFKSGVEGRADVTHFRVNGQPISATGVTVRYKEEARIELWAGGRGRVVASLRFVFEEV